MKLLLVSWGIGALPGFLPSGSRIGYINEAVRLEGEADWINAESRRLSDLGYEVVHVSLENLATELEDMDAVYVCGGNTFVLLDGLKRTRADQILIERVRAGLPYIGLSAGAAICGSPIEPIRLMDDAGAAPELASTDALGFVPQVIVPHADGGFGPYDVALNERINAEYGGQFTLRNLGNCQALLVTDEGVQLIKSP
ncbi:Type 1 glutamine amidotransferase-like domain-containing protein [Corynebacterium sp. H130]|uniref:Type 1 glutamine amidotransferase-like domain-containing protein n=1 Tax=Corynebacterium sp. H130 TaxID=3133444 RepID=UPI0030959C9A